MAVTYYGTDRAVVSGAGSINVIDQDRTLVTPNAAALYVNPGSSITVILRSRLVDGGGPASIGRGIEAYDCPNLTIVFEGGSVADFFYGIRAERCPGLRLIRPHISSALFYGIRAEGNDVSIEDARVTSIGGTLALATARTFGVAVAGSRPKIVGGIVENVTGKGDEGVAYSLHEGGDDGLIKDCYARNSTIPPLLGPNALFPGGRPGSIGYWIGGTPGPDLALINNHATCFGLAYAQPATVIDPGSNTASGCTYNYEPVPA